MKAAKKTLQCLVPKFSFQPTNVTCECDPTWDLEIKKGPFPTIALQLAVTRHNSVSIPCDLDIKMGEMTT